jgi:hypothetical protein
MPRASRKAASRRKGKRATLDRKQQRAFKRAIQGRDSKIIHP